MFWNLVLEPGRRYSSIIREPFHLSMATLDVKTVKHDNDLIPVLLKIDGKEDSILCNLSKSNFPQSALDLNFDKGTKVAFFTTGNATVHLTGYLIQDDAFDDSDFSEDSSESGDATNEQASGVKGQGDTKTQSQQKKKRKSEEILDAVSKKKTKSKSGDEDGSKNGLDMRMKTLNDSKASDSDEDDDDDDDDDDDLNDLDSSDSNLGSDDLLSGDDDDDDDEEEDSDADDDDDEDDDDDDDSDASEETKPQKTPQQTPKKKPDEKTPKQGKNVQNQTPSSNKKQNKQNLTLPNGATPKSDKKGKNKDTPQKKQGDSNKDTPQPKQGGNSKDTPQKQAGSPKKQTLAGGVQIEELKTGNGPVAKPGKMVAVYYTGRLKTNNRVFDQSNKGPGFKFRLGKGEVIKGWDIGVSGMTVGSKRRITCPPNMAYGNKGSSPQIPPNSTLVFDVELKSVN